VKPSDRKLRLFYCTCVRRVWPLLTDERWRTAVETAEQYAEGAITKWQLRLARAKAEECILQGSTLVHAALATVSWWVTSLRLGKTTARVTEDTAMLCADNTAKPRAAAAFEDRVRASNVFHTSHDAERRHQADLLRDLFGPLPFRPLMLDPAWRTPSVLALARRAYDDRHLPSGTLDATLLGVLADALEDAGCEHEEVLSHLRQQGAAHGRGCWPVDLLLAKS
jgi:hypothetical protein